MRDAANWTGSAVFFFFNDTGTTQSYPLSLHDALPISEFYAHSRLWPLARLARDADALPPSPSIARSEEHTSELQSHSHLVCRLLLEKKNKNKDLANRQQPAASAKATPS